LYNIIYSVCDNTIFLGNSILFEGSIDNRVFTESLLSISCISEILEKRSENNPGIRWWSS